MLGWKLGRELACIARLQPFLESFANNGQTWYFRDAGDITQAMVLDGIDS